MPEYYYPGKSAQQSQISRLNLISPGGDEVTPVSAARQSAALATNAFILPGSFGCGCAALRILRLLALAAWFAVCPVWTAIADSLDYAIIVTGEELLQGVYADGHTQFITRTLLPLGGHCVWSLTVDDRPEDLKQALEFVLRRAKMVVVTGGLGPTLNDITRETLSEFTGIPLVESPDLVAEMERRFGTPADKLRANLRRQCLVPRRGGWLPNPFGTAAGLVFEHDDYVLIALPGPPRELQPMLRDRVIPYLERKYGVRPHRSSITLRFVGIGQSQIEQTIRDGAFVPSDVWVSTQFEGGRVDYTFSLPEDNETNRTRLRDLARRVREVFGEHIYAEGTTTLEERVVELFKAHRIRLVIVEIGSAGRLTAALSHAPGATDVVTASYVALTEQQMRVLLNVPDARWSAAGGPGDRLRCIAEVAKERTGADWAIAVGPINTDQDASSEALAGAGDLVREWQTQRFPAQGKGELVQANLVTHVLARVRRQLEQ